ncbi:cytochrome P450 [Rhypophila decipiens]|uniref:Cytochrome P450 n=1 Tax=Rhypophila decipiens TaxID=261697 RepID=A0AAN7B0Y9_9PEZI|nr:cytochrome P450 [Rhypophila decipiens]
MLTQFLIAALVLGSTILYRKLRYVRFQQYAHLPQHPTSLVLGHLKLMGEFIKRNKPDAHVDLAFVAMHQALGRAPLMFLDARPIGDPVVIVGSYEIAEQISKSSNIFPTSPPKSSRSLTRLMYMMGPKSIFSSYGDEWKHLRRTFNPGFAKQYLATFHREVLDKGLIFLDRLVSLARNDEAFSLVHLTTRLTFDIIGKVVLESDFGAQHEDNHNANKATEGAQLIRLFGKMLDEYKGETHNLPWWLTPLKVKRRSALAKRITSVLQSIVRRKHAEILDSQAGSSGNPRSVLSLSLQDIPTLTPDILDSTCDQLRTFLFAGHDTTAILLSWVFYELSRHPDVLRAVRTELDSLLGPDDSPDKTYARLLEHGGDLNMPYISAVIKETLRLHPPAGTGRIIPAGSNFSVRTTTSGGVEEQTLLLDGLLVYICQSMVHTDPKVYGDTAHEFVPERWLDSDHPIPAGAWRPFERGPRNCIGQELAIMEARLVIALVARRYDFVKVGLGAVVLDHETGQPVVDPTANGRRYKVAEELYTTRQVTQKPVDGMLMKVKLAS